jgi:hypothetical protein
MLAGGCSDPARHSAVARRTMDKQTMLESAATPIQKPLASASREK